MYEKCDEMDVMVVMLMQGEYMRFEIQEIHSARKPQVRMNQMIYDIREEENEPEMQEKIIDQRARNRS